MMCLPAFAFTISAISLLSGLTVSLMTGSNFEEARVCLNSNCFKTDEGILRCWVECAALCHNEAECIGFVNTNVGKCTLLHTGCFLDTAACHVSAQNLLVYKKTVLLSTSSTSSSTPSPFSSMATTAVYNGSTTTATTSTFAGTTNGMPTTNVPDTANGVISSLTTSSVTTNENATSPVTSTGTTNEITTSSATSTDITTEVTESLAKFTDTTNETPISSATSTDTSYKITTSAAASTYTTNEIPTSGGTSTNKTNEITSSAKSTDTTNEITASSAISADRTTEITASSTVSTDTANEIPTSAATPADTTNETTPPPATITATTPSTSTTSTTTTTTTRTPSTTSAKTSFITTPSTTSTTPPSASFTKTTTATTKLSTTAPPPPTTTSFTTTATTTTTITTPSTTTAATTTTAPAETTKQITTTTPEESTTTAPTSDTTKAITTAPQCLNGGQWDTTRGACACQNGFVGNVCGRYPYNCEELLIFAYPFDTYEVYIDINRDQSHLIYTRCHVQSSNFVGTYIFVNDGGYSQDLSTADYILGFTSSSETIWLGLENVRLFNQAGYTDVAFGVVMNGKEQGLLNWWYTYQNFQIQDKAGGYSFTVDAFNPARFGTYFLTKDYAVEDVLGQSHGVGFSTVDSDRDLESAYNCASRAGTGWWFKTCPDGMPMNFLGLNPRSSAINDPEKKVRIPGINMSDPEVKDAFMVVFMQFYTRPASRT